MYLRSGRGVRSVVVGCALLLAGVYCLSQQNAASGMTYPVRGVVENSVTHQPIARARVDGGSDAVLTDNNGVFELQLPVGEITLHVTRPEYAPLYLDRRMSAGEVMPELHMSLIPLAGISAQVSLSNGDNPDGTQFTTYCKFSRTGHPYWATVGGASANSEGAFRILQIPAPTTCIICSQPMSTHHGSITTGYPPTCYSSAADFGSATPVNLVPGQYADISFALMRQPFYRVAIAIPGFSVDRGLSLIIRDQSGKELGFPVEWDKKRKVAITEVPQGNYTAEARTWGDATYFGKIDFRIADEPASGLTLTMLQVQPLVVRIHTEFTPNTNEATVNAAVKSVRGLILTHADSTTEGAETVALHPVGASDSGSYVAGNVTIPGQYWVEVPNVYGYVSSIVSGGTDLARERLTIGPEGNTAPIDITVRNDGGRMDVSLDTLASGNETNGTPNSNAVFLYAIPQFPYPTKMFLSSGARNSLLSIQNLPPGTYNVVAMDELQSIDVTDTAAMSHISEMGQTVTVTAGGSATATIKLMHMNSAGASQ